MNYYLFTAAVCITIVALIHSILGEKLIVKPILKLNLPPIMGSETFTKQTVRFGWHLTTLAAIGFAVILITDATATTIQIVALGLLVAAITSALATRFKHFSWWAFLAISILTWLGSK